MMPALRRVIESHTRPILPVAVVVAVAALEAAKGSTLDESFISLLVRSLPRRGAAWQHCGSCKLGPVPWLAPL